MFFSKEKPLLDYGDGMKNSTAKTNAFSLPLTILVNKQTTGAAEAFAGVLRQADIGLLLGTNTAGKATMGKEFTLNTGQRLWVATSLVKLGNGKSFPASGLQPDIKVEVSPADEHAYFEDAYKVLPKANDSANGSTNQTNLSVTNRLARHRTSEAELVRMHRDGELPDLEAPAAKSRETEMPPHVIYDPALARAIDLLKGLSVVQQFRSS
jgi:C-terminal processing protease CtpA/Prc